MTISVVLLEYHSINEISLAVDAIRKHDKECEIVVSSNSLYNAEEQNKAKEAVSNVKWTFNNLNSATL